MPKLSFLSCLSSGVAKDLARAQDNSLSPHQEDNSKVKSMFDSRNPNSHTVKSKKGSAETVEFYEILFDYVKRFPLPNDVKNRVNFEDLRYSDVIESKLKVYNSSTEYDEDTMNVTKLSPKQQKSNILFSSVFTNKTSETQTHHLSAERRTSSSCTVAVCKAMTKGMELELEIAPPSAIVKANAGFRKEISVENDNEQTIEEELSWNVDTEIIVPAGKKTRADLVITEEKFDGVFRIETIMEGQITVALRDKKSNAIISPIVIKNLADVFKPDLGFRPVPGKENAVSYMNEGKCSCQYGIGQRIDLTEEDL